MSADPQSLAPNPQPLTPNPQPPTLTPQPLVPDPRPLAGRTVLVTRPQGQAEQLIHVLAAEGAQPIAVPAIRIEPPESWDGLDHAIARGGYHWVVFTSANGVRFFWVRLRVAGQGSAWFGATRVAAIGPATARSLEDHGIRADLTPQEYVAEALLACLSESGPLEGRRVLLPRADIARDALEVGLRRAGAQVEKVVAYRTVPAAPPPDLVGRLRSGGVDAVTFTSASTVRALMDMLGPEADTLSRTTVACIGPITAATAQRAGLRVDVVATTYTVAGLVAALRWYYARHPKVGGHSSEPYLTKGEL